MDFEKLIQERYSCRHYSDKAIEEIWKWYDSSERKGVANF